MEMCLGIAAANRQPAMALATPVRIMPNWPAAAWTLILPYFSKTRFAAVLSFMIYLYIRSAAIANRQMAWSR
ncbi:MAG TPA: hypothetical protein DHV59_15780 [Oxalobacteraceae bacterium]|nr:hypothetical protein [Oxalobacteraceae bacterium]